MKMGEKVRQLRGKEQNVNSQKIRIKKKGKQTKNAKIRNNQQNTRK